MELQMNGEQDQEKRLAYYISGLEKVNPDGAYHPESPSDVIFNATVPLPAEPTVENPIMITYLRTTEGIFYVNLLFFETAGALCQAQLVPKYNGDVSLYLIQLPVGRSELHVSEELAKIVLFGMIEYDPNLKQELFSATVAKAEKN